MIFADEANARARPATLEVGDLGPGGVTFLSAGLFAVLGEAGDEALDKRGLVRWSRTGRVNGGGGGGVRRRTARFIAGR